MAGMAHLMSGGSVPLGHSGMPGAESVLEPPPQSVLGTFLFPGLPDGFCANSQRQRVAARCWSAGGLGVAAPWAAGHDVKHTSHGVQLFLVTWVVCHPECKLEAPSYSPDPDSV